MKLVMVIAVAVIASVNLKAYNNTQDPVLLSTAQDILDLSATSTDWGLNFRLTADIDMAGASITPIGISTSQFTGNFHGAGHTISNIVITDGDAVGGANGNALLGHVNGSTIDSLGIINITVNTPTDERVAGIVGRAESGSLIDQCYVTGTSVMTGTYRVAGICGWNVGTVSNCWSDATPTSGATGWYHCGGIVGTNDGTVSDCAFYGVLAGGGNNKGGIVGNAAGGSVVTSYYISTAGDNKNIAGTTSLTDAQLQVQSNYIGFDFASTWYMNTYAGLQAFVVLLNPTVSIDSPADGSQYVPGSTINVTVTATPNASSGAAITGVVLNDGTTDHAMVLNGGTGKWETSFTGSAASYMLTATATDANTETGSSPTHSITEEVYTPSVTITSPANASNYTRGTTVTVIADVVPSATTSSPIASVTLKTGMGDVVMLNTSGNTYEASFSANMGSYDLTVEAQDAAGQMKSQMISISMTAPTYSGGTGADALNAFQISTAADLVDWSMYGGHLNKYFELTADIDMQGETFYPIGYYNGDADYAAFIKGFNGHNFVISNLTISKHPNRLATGAMGFFGILQSANGELKNVGFENLNVAGKTGGNSSRCGGAVGYIRWAATIDSCFIRGGSIDGDGNTGGLVGINNNCSISNCFVSASVTANWTAGGIIGATTPAWGATPGYAVSNCVFYGKSNAAVAGIASHGFGGDGTNFIWSGNYFTTSNGATQGNGEGTGLTYTEMLTASNYGTLLSDAAWSMAAGGFAVLTKFGTKASEVTVTPSIRDAWTFGTISPATAQTIGFGASQAFTFTPNNGALATNIWVNGVQEQHWGGITSYTFDPTLQNSTLEVMFEPSTAIQKVSTVADIYTSGNVLHLNNFEAKSTFNVFDLSGKVVYSGVVASEQFTETINLNRGIYMVQVNNGQETQKVILK